MCSGKQSCVFDLSNMWRENIQPCTREVISYLEADYDCVSGRDIM